MCNKDPLKTRIGWKHKSAQLSSEDAANNMLHGMNIGIAGTDMDTLVIIDVDGSGIKTNELKPTLSTTTRSRVGTHHFYFANDVNAKVNIPTDEKGEVRAVWQYVVAPGSYVPCSLEEIEMMPAEQQQHAGKYSLENTTMPQEISFNEFPKAFRNKAYRKQSGDRRREQQQIRTDETEKKFAATSKSALFDLKINDVVGNVPSMERFPSLFHGSKTGANTSISHNKIHCFRHNVSLTPLRAMAVLAGIDTCMNAGVSHRNSGAGNSTIDLTDGKTIAILWKYAKDNNLVPADDPIPTIAMIWYSIQQGICEEDDLIDGWKLPVDDFKKTMDTLKDVKIVEE